MSQEIHTDLERAATYRFLALLFGPPSDELRDELTSLAEVVAPSLREDATAVAAATSKELQGLYHQLLGASGRVPDGESAYDDNSAAGRGPLVADVAGFYRAFAFPAEPPNTPDHIGHELDFLAWLAMKSAYARHEGLDEQREIVEAARASFLRDHLGRWAITFLERLALAGEGTHYEAVAALVSRTLRELEGAETFARPSRRTKLPLLDDSEDVSACG
ncbi:MAG: molecular chaperone TorD family protein [Sandaracinus sp.]